MTGDDRDRVYAGPLADIAGFRFDHRVAAVFPDMIKRSVPGYETIVAMTGTLAERYAHHGTRLYDLLPRSLHPGHGRGHRTEGCPLNRRR